MQPVPFSEVPIGKPDEAIASSPSASFEASVSVGGRTSRAMEPISNPRRTSLRDRRLSMKKGKDRGYYGEQDR
jgi:hypothetical protein